jgi:hypothetical protein
VAMEGDQEIFKAILKPLIVDLITNVFKKHHLNVDQAFEMFEDEELPATVVVARNQYYK